MQNNELTKILAWIVCNYPKDFTAIKSDDVYDLTREYISYMFVVNNISIGIKFTYPVFNKHFGFIASVDGDTFTSNYINISLSDEYFETHLEPSSFEEFKEMFQSLNLDSDNSKAQ